MVLVPLVGAVLLHVSNPGDELRTAEKAYFACLLKVAKRIDDGIPGDNPAIGATIEASCQAEAWAYLAASKRAGRSGDISDEACKAIRTARHLPIIPAYARGKQGPFCGA